MICNSSHLPGPKFSCFYFCSRQTMPCGARASSGGSFISLCVATRPSRGRRGRDRPTGDARVMNINRDYTRCGYSASLVPSEIFRPKSVQAIKIDRVVVARRMQHLAVRRGAGLFVADLGVARETAMVI